VSHAPEDSNNLAVTAGLRHVALNVDALEDCLRFYAELLGMRIEWQPDADNVFLCSGTDNLALHRRLEPVTAARDRPPASTSSAPPAPATPKTTEVPESISRLDHIGFIVDNIDDIDRWHSKLEGAGVTIAQPPKTHRDGARSFYCYDPDGTLVQLIYHPPISRGRT